MALVLGERLLQREKGDKQEKHLLFPVTLPHSEFSVP